MNVPPPNLETRAADLRVVLDAVGSERPVLAGLIEGGAANALFAATSPIASKETATLQSLMNAGHADRVEFLG